MRNIPKLNGLLFSAMLGGDDTQAVVKTLTASSQLVFADVLEYDELVEFWAEEEFSYCISASPTAIAVSSHRLQELTTKLLIIPAGSNMAIIGTANSKKFYLSK